MEPLTTVIAAILASSAAAKWNSSARFKRERREWQAGEFASFRGQHFRYLSRSQIARLLYETACKHKWQIRIDGNCQKPLVFEAIVTIHDAGHSLQLFLRCSLESYGRFFQIHYEWNASSQALKTYTSPESRAMYDFIKKVERSIGEAELQKSRKEYRMAGSRFYSNFPFAPESIRYILSNAVSARDSQGHTIAFTASLDVRQNPWLDLVEAYVNVEDSSGFHLRFYRVEQADLAGVWELRCDWLGSITAMTDADSPEWSIVRALVTAVEREMEKRGAEYSFPPPRYEHLLNLGLYQVWDYQILWRLLKGVARSYIGHDYICRERFLSRLQFDGKFLKRKTVPGSVELDLRVWSYEAITGSSLFVCFHFQPLPPKWAELKLAWSGKEADQALLSVVIRDMEKRMLSRLSRVGALRLQGLSTMEIDFLSQSDDLKAAIPIKGLWPTPQDYNEAVQSPQLCFDDPELKTADVTLNALGIPRAASGAFASVYRLSGQGTWALRCFNEPVKDQLLRYEKTSRFVSTDDLPYTVSCQYLEEGIRVFGKWYPVVKMEWVEGTPINTFIGQIIKDKTALLDLRIKFQKMMDDLRRNGIAHGDLQHGNIMIREGEFVLVDYDNMYVPELAGFVSWETGHRNYQHPRRSSRHFGPYLDNFSAWVIDSALMCLAVDARLWYRFGEGDESLLFSAQDFLYPDDSELLHLLLRHKNGELAARAEFLLSLLALDVSRLPSLS